MSVASTESALPTITDVIATGNNQATVTFELRNGIKPLISTLSLIYGQFLNVNALTFNVPIPSESIPDFEGAPGNITATQLDTDISYQFKLITVIGLYTYESEVVILDAVTENTTASDMATTDAVTSNDTTTLTDTTVSSHIPTTPGTTTTRPTTPSTTTARPTTPGATNDYYTTAAVTEAISTDDGSSLVPMITEVVANSPQSILVAWSKLNGVSGYVIHYFDETGNLNKSMSVSLHVHIRVYVSHIERKCPD